MYLDCAKNPQQAEQSWLLQLILFELQDLYFALDRIRRSLKLVSLEYYLMTGIHPSI